MLLQILKEIGPYLAVILSLLFVVWRARGILDKYGNKLDQIINTTNVNTNLIGNLSHVLTEREVINSDDLLRINEVYQASLNIQPLNPNPLTNDEITRLNNYINKSKHQLLNLTELEDFKSLVQKLKDEYPDAASTTKLVNYAAFLTGTHGNST